MQFDYIELENILLDSDVLGFSLFLAMKINTTVGAISVIKNH
jgi:hypothetical protein